MAGASRRTEATRVRVMRESHRSRRVALGQLSFSVIWGELQIWDDWELFVRQRFTDGAVTPGKSAGTHYCRRDEAQYQARLNSGCSSPEAMISRERPQREPDETSRAQPSPNTVAPITTVGATKRDSFIHYPGQ